MKQKNKDNTVFWWIGWIVLTIVSFFISCWFWTGIIARYIGSVHEPNVQILWVTAVFGSWMVLLVPLIIVMYNKVDRAYEDARLRREAEAFERSKSDPKARGALVEEKDRELGPELKKKLKGLPQAIKRGHLVDVVLRDGRRVPNVFIADKRELMGIYDYHDTLFKAADIADLWISDLDHLPKFEEAKWVRLDGVGEPV